MAIYYTYDGKYHKFYSYRQLINWLAMHNYHDYSPYDNSFLRRCGNNSNDSYVALEWENYRVRYPRDYRIYDEDWHAILNGGIIADVREATYNATMEQARVTRVRQDKEWQDALAQVGYPRPYTWRSWHERHPKSHSYGNYKHGASLRDFRYAADPEHAPYIRAARNLNHLPNVWWDDWGKCSSGWKYSTKNRHQWEAKAKREAARQQSCGLFAFL